MLDRGLSGVRDQKRQAKTILLRSQERMSEGKTKQLALQEKPESGQPWPLLFSLGKSYEEDRAVGKQKAEQCATEKMG